MRSQHADTFNHDDCAEEYDEDVLDEAFPIRTGYSDTLNWVAEKAAVAFESRVLELGSGTGNLSALLPPCRELVCVDVSRKMEVLAMSKVAEISNRRFIEDDLLGVFDRDLGMFDAVVSTYAIHHLLEDEKALLFEKVWKCLSSGGCAVFGDLMLENRNCREAKIAEYRDKGEMDTMEAIAEEFFWLVDEAEAALSKLGFSVEVKRFSDLSFGIVARKV